MRKFCFVCGKKTDDLTAGRCRGCYREQIKLVKVPKRIVIVQCKKCEQIRIRNKWKQTDIKDVILDSVKFLEKNVQLEIKGSERHYEVTASNKKTEKHKVEVAIKKTICDVCARKFTQYYEAAIQIRGYFNDEIIEFIEDLLIIQARKDRKAFYTFHETDEGLDIRIGSKPAAWNIAETMKKKFGCKIVRSNMLIGKKKGKEIYRDYICLRF